MGLKPVVHHKSLNMRFKCDGIIRYKGQYFIPEIKMEAFINGRTVGGWLKSMLLRELHTQQLLGLTR